MATAHLPKTLCENAVRWHYRPADIGHPPQQIVDRWELLERLGEGGLCRVYLARPVAEQSCPAKPTYAVKVLRERWRDESRVIDILRREARVGAAVSHPNVVPVLSASTGGPPYFIVMPRLVGDTLATALANSWRPKAPVALWIARQIALGLAAIETTCGMIHGDVKPDNIFLAPNGHATLIDLGFARAANESRTAVDRPLLGTLHYAAPESITSALAADVRSDLYSLGVTLYEMLAGVPPLDADNPAELARMHRESKPVCIRKRRPDLPKPIASLVHTMLCKDPIRRPQSPREVVNWIVRLEVDWFAARAA